MYDIKNIVSRAESQENAARKPEKRRHRTEVRSERFLEGKCEIIVNVNKNKLAIL